VQAFLKLFFEEAKRYHNQSRNMKYKRVKGDYSLIYLFFCPQKINNIPSKIWITNKNECNPKSLKIIS